MYRRILSFALVLLLTFTAASAAFAADGDENGAAQPAVISFDTTTTGWQNFSYVGFHIWGVDGEAFYDWGGKAQRGTDEDGDGVWTYDLEAKGLELDPDKQYAVIFYTDLGQQTYNLLFDTTCYGDVAYGETSQVLENPEDSQKYTLPAYWSGQDPTINGPELKITSIGNVVGSCVPRSTTREAMFAGFLQNTLANARAFSDLSDQELIDHVGEGLELGADMVQILIDASGEAVEWSYDASTLAKEPYQPVIEDPTGPEWYEFNAYVAEGSGTAKVSTNMWDADAWEEDDSITLTATPAEGYHFGYWEIIGTYRIFEGDLTTPVLLIHPYSNITAKAHMIETVPGNSDYVAYTVDVAQGEGTAKGDKEVLKINYTVAPEYQYDTVTLTATPAEGYFFDGWTITGDFTYADGCNSNDAVVTLICHDSISAQARFAIAIPVEPGSIRGDADGDGKVTILDATRIQRWLAKMVGDDGIDLTAADADGDGKVTVLDATRIQRVLAKLCDMEGNPLPKPGQDELEIIVFEPGPNELPILG